MCKGVISSAYTNYTSQNSLNEEGGGGRGAEV